MPIKVIHIIGKAKIGGVEISVQQFLENSINGKLDLQHFLIANFKNATLQIPKNIKCINLATNTENPFKIIFNAIKISQLIKKHNIDIVHSYNRNTTFTSFFIQKFLNKKIKTVSTISGLYKLSGIFRKILNSVFLKTDYTIATSQCVKKHFLSNYKKTSPDKISVIYEGIDPKNLPPFPHKEKQKSNQKQNFKIVMLARFSKIKGQEILIHALKNLPPNIPYECILIGPSKKKYENYLKKLISKNHVNAKIHNENSSHLIQYSDLIVCPSTRGESFGRVAVEAGFLKKISLVSNKGGHLEVVKDKITGFYFEIGSTKDLAKKIIHIYNLSEKEKITIQENAFHFVNENFSIENHVNKKNYLYLKICKIKN